MGDSSAGLEDVKKKGANTIVGAYLSTTSALSSTQGEEE